MVPSHLTALILNGVAIAADVVKTVKPQEQRNRRDILFHWLIYRYISGFYVHNKKHKHAP